MISTVRTEGSPKDARTEKVPGCPPDWPDRVGDRRLVPPSIQPRQTVWCSRGAPPRGPEFRQTHRVPPQATAALAAARRRRQNASPRTAAPAQAA